MKKIILFTVIIIFIPFVIVSFFKIDKKEEINLNEIALIEDALKEYISLDSRLIIKQLTRDFFDDEVRYILFSK